MKCARLMWIANVLGFYVVQLAAQSQYGPESGTRYVITNLGTFGGSSGSSASGVNNKGLVTGYEALQNGNQHAFMWKNGHKTDLGTRGAKERDKLILHIQQQVAAGGQVFAIAAVPPS